MYVCIYIYIYIYVNDPGCGRSRRNVGPEAVKDPPSRTPLLASRNASRGDALTQTTIRLVCFCGGYVQKRRTGLASWQLHGDLAQAQP